MSLQRSGIPIPLYHQLQDILNRKIDNGEFQPGSLIPSEEQLQKEYGISRVTVRQAISQLVLAGKLRRVQGKGTFVTERKFLEWPGSLRSIGEEIRALNLIPECRFLSSGVRPAASKVASLLGIQEDAQVVYMERVRYGSGEPFFLAESYLPYSLVPDILERGLVEGSLYMTLEKTYGFTLHQADEELEGSLATRREAELLDLEPGAPVLVARRVTYVLNGRAIDYTKLTFSSKRYTYQIRLQRGNVPLA